MHDAGIRECFQALLRVPVTQHMWEMASLPFALGGLCLRNAERLRSTAHWASWADTLPVIRARHPDVADHMLVSFSRGVGGLYLEAANESRDRLDAAGVDAPEWGDVASRAASRVLTQMTSFPEFHAQGGSPSLLQQWRALSSGVQCGQGWVPLNKRLPVHSKVPWLGNRSTVPRHQRRLVWTRSVFASFSCAASGARSPSRPPSAGVASHLTPVATTEQRVRHQGCSDVGGFPWRVVPRASAERLE